MSITAVPISMRFVRAPIAARSGNGDASCWAKWWTRKYAPSAPRSSTASASSIDWMSASDPDRTFEYGDADQWPKDRNPIFFTSGFYGRGAFRPRSVSPADAAERVERRCAGEAEHDVPEHRYRQADGHGQHAHQRRVQRPPDDAEP